MICGGITLWIFIYAVAETLHMMGEDHRWIDGIRHNLTPWTQERRRRFGRQPKDD